MKTSNEIIETIIEKTNRVLDSAKSAKAIYDELYTLRGEIGENIIDLIASNSHDFTKDIAVKFNTSSNKNLSEKQCWCLAYQVFNNIEVYKISNNNQ